MCTIYDFKPTYILRYSIGYFPGLKAELGTKTNLSKSLNIKYNNLYTFVINKKTKEKTGGGPKRNSQVVLKLQHAEVADKKMQA